MAPPNTPEPTTSIGRPWPVQYLEPSPASGPLGLADEAPGGVRGAVLERWFDGIACGRIRPDAEAVTRCLAELAELDER